MGRISKSVSELTNRLMTSETIASKAHREDQPQIMGKANPMQGAVGSGACFVTMNGENDRFAHTGAMMLTEDQTNPLIAPGVYDPLTEEVRINPRQERPSSRQCTQDYLTRVNE